MKDRVFCIRCGTVPKRATGWSGWSRVCKCSDGMAHWRGPLPRPWKVAR